MLDGRSCVVPRLFSSSCQSENDWSYMKYLLDLDIKNGKRPMEIDAEDEPQPRKCNKILDSCHRVETAPISFQQQSCHAKDSVILQMDQETILSICQGVEEVGDWTDQLPAEQVQQNDGDSMEFGDHQSDKQKHGQPKDSSDSGIQLSDERQQQQQQQQHVENLLNSSDQQSDELQQHNHAGDSSDSGSLLPRMNRDSSIACLSRCSRSDYGSLASLNRSFRNTIRSGELYKWRRLNGIMEHWVYFSCALLEWEAYDPIRQRWMHLPRMASNECFMCSDKESLAVGTELLVFGRELRSHVIFRYSLLTNSWSSGMRMNAPRCLFGSASLGEIAILAGGCDSEGRILDSAELYNSETQTWETLPSMRKPRKMCSGIFMDGKFYVIGGIGGSDSKLLMCGEEYNLQTRTWTEIPNMSPGRSSRASEMPATAEAPPLVAVVNNELFAADYADMEVKKYDKDRKLWFTIGRLPERAVSMNGWGLAFRACGNRLIVIGGPRTHGEGFIELNSWVPSEGPPQWHLLARKRSGNFVYNCAVMGC
ncbi:F-box/kelch-repeat protein At1g26930-like isoform X1 [Gastrolobium bilobum]|uniref:F-box/kelch-repeat protein At1g26930-like isoform X1 n=1 Tax=Gastrolobium bilobum TaxID=150636 RepID=UPI002AAFF019|nr:F-box/kelch-repeat protein At1g26930-like isoform X1 [Gastrolobium bilobum]XP_061338769.1 F-box/kelch-repeat protein At1g26930-like isoform X1 [Gastrolobium bilobum]XP_061338770.1 F-box/kelch-repeat protein At1g26930-like isoform X1 [Gastrolobium bilobum]